MNSLPIMHDILRLVAEFIIVLLIIKLNKFTLGPQNSLNRKLAFSALILAVISFASFFTPSKLLPHHILGLVLTVLILSNTLLGISTDKKLMRNHFSHHVLGKLTVLTLVATMTFGALELVRNLKN